MAAVTHMLYIVFMNCISWFSAFLNAITGGVRWWATAVFVHLSFKFILRPLFGVASSDLAKSNYNAFRRSRGDK